MNKPMTAEQIKNWREVFCGMLGPYALIMPEEMVIKFRDKFQSKANELTNAEAA